MDALQQNNLIFPAQMETIYQSNTCTASRYEDAQGSLITSRHTVFPGIQLQYQDFCRSGSNFHLESPGSNILAIEHCLEGRVEFQMNDESFYLTAGDVLLRRADGIRGDIHFPAKAYRGISIHLDLKKTPQCLACILADVDVEPDMLVRKFGLDDNAFHFLRKNEHLAEHMDAHITVGELAKHFKTSQTQLKESFRLVYGTSVQGFICEQKMQAAAIFLKETDRKVGDIAGEFGYANASKFSAAFQRVMGKSPAQYRQEIE